MKQETIITIILLILGLGIGLAFDAENSTARPGWVHNLQWPGEQPDNVAKIEELLFLEIAPYKTEYEMVNISSNSDINNIHIRVMATTIDSDNPDIYDFVYENDELLLTGYLLEAIPVRYRNEAITIALNDRDVASSVRNSGDPSVKRILPGTSQKFYVSKTLLSVTWKGISALIDPEEKKVVQVWKESGTAN
ncbi:MAG: hypothetical protein C3F06_07545 [Candidatus Methanoperedenaceae archaeon]|nr:MAG: hypothetical protein C3F06_07545 [Candidatus Methanoperedenaceae archaeon]